MLFSTGTLRTLKSEPARALMNIGTGSVKGVPDQLHRHIDSRVHTAKCVIVIRGPRPWHYSLPDVAP